jgi:hypothetical protein
LTRSGLRLLDEAPFRVAVDAHPWREKLERDRPVQVGVPSPEDDAHPPFAEFLEDLVVRDDLAGLHAFT